MRKRGGSEGIYNVEGVVKIAQRRVDYCMCALCVHYVCTILCWQHKGGRGVVQCMCSLFTVPIPGDPWAERLWLKVANGEWPAKKVSVSSRDNVTATALQCVCEKGGWKGVNWSVRVFVCVSWNDVYVEKLRIYMFKVCLTSLT